MDAGWNGGWKRVRSRSADEPTTGVIPRDFESQDLVRTARIAVASGELLHAAWRLSDNRFSTFTVCALLLRCYTVTSFRFNS
jgi:hypothetical protein